jgi:hypothetical protein
LGKLASPSTFLSFISFFFVLYLLKTIHMSKCKFLIIDKFQTVHAYVTSLQLGLH